MGGKLHSAIGHLVIVILGIAITGTIAGYYSYFGSHDYHTYPKYAYNYGVQDKYTGDFKTAKEARDGDITRGSYSVLQPDGILRTVKYWVDKTGFHATVLNSGPGIHGEKIIPIG